MPVLALSWFFYLNVKLHDFNLSNQIHSNHTHTRLTALFPGLPRWAGTRKVKPIWILLKQETVSGSGVSWAICKSAPCSRQITTPAPHHSVFFTGRMLFLPPNQQHQSTEVNIHSNQHLINTMSNSKDIFRLTNLTTRSRNYCGIGIIHYAKLTKWCFRICCFFTEFWEPYLFDIWKHIYLGPRNCSALCWLIFCTIQIHLLTYLLSCKYASCLLLSKRKSNR